MTTPPRAVLRVVHVVPGSSPAAAGGRETMLHYLLSEFAGNADYAAAVVLLGDSPVRGAIERLGVPVHVLPTFPLCLLRFLVLARWWRAIIDSAKAEIVHTHGYRSDYFVWALRRLRPSLLDGLKVVSHCHGWDTGSLRGRLATWLDVRALKDSDRVIAVSDALARQTARWGVPEEKLAVVRNWAPAWLRPVDPQRPRAASRPFVVGVIGRLVRVKRVDVVLEAARILSRSQKAIEFRIIGDGPRRRRLMRLSESLGVDGSVSFHGRVTPSARAFADLDILVLASESEGLPLVLLEAMRLGVPVVATRVGGVPELVRHDVDGLLVPPGDPVELAAAIRRLAGDETLRKRIREKAWKRSDPHHDWRSGPAALREVYASLRVSGYPRAPVLMSLESGNFPLRESWMSGSPASPARAARRRLG